MSLKRRIGLEIPRKQKESLDDYKDRTGIGTTTIITRLLDMFFRGEVKLTDDPIVRTKAYGRRR